jgi:hypothetical protein
MTSIHGFEPENIAEECAVRLGVFTVDNYMSRRNHFAPPKKQPEQLPACPVESRELNEQGCDG